MKSDEYFLNLLKTKKVIVNPETGEVQSRLLGRLRRVGAKQSSGYLHMSAGPSRAERHYILLHRLVWLAVHGDLPDGYEINHINGDKIDNRIANLELVTRSENVKHAHYSLGKVFGVWGDVPRATSRTSKEKVAEILSLLRRGNLSKSEIARRVGVSRVVVGRLSKEVADA